MGEIGHWGQRAEGDMHWVDKERGIERGRRELWEGMKREWKVCEASEGRPKAIKRTSGAGQGRESRLRDTHKDQARR